MSKSLEKLSHLAWKVVFVNALSLKEHEMITHSLLEELMNDLKKTGILKKPIIVDLHTKIILDGHHRYRALLLLGAKIIPAFMVDYKSSKVTVSSWRPGVQVTKNMVIRAGLTGRKLPPKTSRHILVGVKVPEINYPIKKLIKGDPDGYPIF